MANVNKSFEEGDRIRVVYEVVEYHPSGRKQGKVEQEDVGEIVSKPSSKFDWPDDNFDFDYEIEHGNAIRSVDIEGEHVCQLHYDAGGDRDWDRWPLAEITRLD